MTYIISQIIGWIATVFRAGGMLAKNPNRIKLLVSAGNLGWMISGILTGNIPLIASNAICIIVMAAELIKGRHKDGRKRQNDSTQ
jgi:hypothetical protein